MDLSQLRQLFDALEPGPDNCISTDKLVQAIQTTVSNKNLEQIVKLFDISGSDRITFENFRNGVAGLEQYQVDNALSESNLCTPVALADECVTSLPNTFLDHSSEHYSTESAPFPDLPTVRCLEEFLTEADVSVVNISESLSSICEHSKENMSAIENKLNGDSFNISQDEEHFEFTPNDGFEDELKKNDIVDGDFSFSNGESFNSLKPNFSQRNTWINSSFKKPNHMKRSFNSSHYTSTPTRNSPTNGASSHSSRSSISYESDEMNIDHSSMDDYISHLTDKLKKLQEQIQSLREGQLQNDEKYSNMKKENSNLHNKIDFLEEQIRDIEFQSDAKRKEDEQRFLDSMARIEREKTQELDKRVNQVFALQKELLEAKEEVKRHLQTIERLQQAKTELEEKVQDRNEEIEALKLEIVRLKDTVRLQNEESHANSSLIEALNQELATNNRKPSDSSQLESRIQHEAEIMSSINSELEQKLRSLKEENRSLKEANEELTAQVLNNHLIEGKSLLKEGEAISSLANEISDLNTEQLKTTLKEQQDVNAKLRAYIDGILLNIVENYPQLLEVKPH